MAEKRAEQEIEEAKVPTSQRLMDAFNGQFSTVFEKDMTPTAFAKALEESAANERRVSEIPLISQMNKPIADAYRDAVLNYGVESEEAQDMYKLLQKEVAKSLAMAGKDGATQQLLKEDPKFKDVSLDASPDKVAALIAAEMENQADLKRGELLEEARAKEANAAKRAEKKGRGEVVAANEPMSPPKGIPGKAAAPRQAGGKREPAGIA